MRSVVILVKRYLFALASCLYLFSFGWLRGRNRALMAAICEHFGLETRMVDLELPEVTIEALLGDPVPVRIPEPTPRDGNVSAPESLVIAGLAAACSPARCFEFGTFDGRTALTLAANATSGARVFSLDLPAEQLETTGLALEHADRAYVDKPLVGSRLLGRPEGRLVTQLLGDSATVDFSPYRGLMDLVLVDGAHAYDYVISDSRQALQMLHSGKGVILWHDYGGWPGVTLALNHLTRHGSRVFGPATRRRHVARLPDPRRGAPSRPARAGVHLNGGCDFSIIQVESFRADRTKRPGPGGER